MPTAKTKVAWSKGVATSGGGVAATIADVRNALGPKKRPAKKQVRTGRSASMERVTKLIDSKGEVRELRSTDLRKFKPASEVLSASVQVKLGARGRQDGARRRASTLERTIQTLKLDQYELEVLKAFDGGKLRSVATKAELAKYREAARATGIKDKRVNIRLSSGDLADIQARALAEGMPYQTLISSVLHKFVTGRLVEPAKLEPRRSLEPNRHGRRRSPASGQD